METIKVYESTLKKLKEFSKEENREELEKQYEHLKEYIEKEELLLESIEFGVKHIYSIIFEAKEVEALTEEMEEKYLGLVENLKLKFEEVKRQMGDDEKENKLDTDFDYIIISEEQEKEEIDAEITRQDEKICEILKKVEEENIQNFEEEIYNSINILFFKEKTLEKLRTLFNKKEEEIIEENKCDSESVLKPIYYKAIDLIINHLQTIDEYEMVRKIQEIRSNVTDTAYSIHTIDFCEEKVIDNKLKSIYERMSNINRTIISLRNIPIRINDEIAHNARGSKEMKSNETTLQDELERPFKELFGEIEEDTVDESNVVMNCDKEQIEEEMNFSALDKLLEKAEELDNMYMETIGDDIKKFGINQDKDEFETKVNEHVDNFEKEIEKCINNLQKVVIEARQSIEIEVERFRNKNNCKKEELVRTCMQKLDKIENE